MKPSKLILENRILFTILAPVLIVGAAISGLIVYLSTPFIVTMLQERTEAELKLASDLGLTICEERFNYLLDLRLENDPEVVAALRKEASEEIKRISNKFHQIHMLIVQDGSRMVASSQALSADRLRLPEFSRSAIDRPRRELWPTPVRMHYRYFPFWRWHIVSYISERDFLAPISLMKRIVHLTTFGVLAVVVGALIVAFHWLVNRPLKKIIEATEGVADGRWERIASKGKGEIGRVALAFNTMVDRLEENRRVLDRTVAELSESEARYRLLTEHSLTCIAMIRKGRFTFANYQTAASLGYSLDEFIGMRVDHLIHPEDRRHIRQKMVAVQRGNPPVDQFECRFVTKAGEVRWFQALVTFALYQGHNTLLAHAIDITEREAVREERERLEARLRQAQKIEVVGTLAAGVAHDLNNILCGLVGYPELLLMRIPEDSPLRGPLETIQNTGHKAAEVVQDLLTLARRGVAIQEVVNLNDIVTDYLASPEHQRLRGSHGNVRYEVQLDEELPNTVGSTIHLAKTVMNLISNASEAIAAEGGVQVATFRRHLGEPLKGFETVPPGDYVVLKVADTGQGISTSDMTKIFEPFYTKKVMGRSGTGLGMTVVWSTVKDHAGFIDINTAQGGGTSFEIYLPTTSQPLEQPARTITLDHFRGHESVLLVEDEAEQREIATMLLSELGYQVTAVASGAEAVQYLRTGKADLLVLDMIMEPEMDGLETYLQILELHPRQKAIIVSGFAETGRVRKARELGASAYVKKPYTLEKLATAVRSALDE